MARDAGLVYRKSEAKVSVSTIHSILRTRLYTGWYEWNGKMIQGRHEPLASVDLWERVHGVMDGSFVKKHRRMTHDFRFLHDNLVHRGCVDDLIVGWRELAH